MGSRLRRRGVRHPAALTCLLVAALAPMWTMGRADAALTEVTMTPDAGPSGTTVTVNGSACGPGLLVNPSRASVLAATLGISIDVAVPANGEWFAQFVVPAGALEGLHAVVVTCTRDLVPLPYVPLAFTVQADAPAPTTTLETAGATTTTVVSTTIPSTTTPSSSTTLTPGAVPPVGGPPLDGENRSAGVAVSTTMPDRTTAPGSTSTQFTLTDTARDSAATPVAIAVSAARAARDDRRRSLVFGALSPIGRGWVGWLVSALIFATVVSAAFAILWFRWLRHTRAREWWARWMHQVLRIRSHARPPT